MYTRKWIVSALVLVALAFAVLITNRATALRQLAQPVVSHSDEVFYSPSIENIVNPGSASQTTNQVLYSPSIEGFIHPGHQIANQVFYSPYIETLIH